MASILITLLNLIPPVPGKKAVQWCQLCQLLSKSRSMENFLSFLSIAVRTERLASVCNSRIQTVKDQDKQYIVCVLVDLSVLICLPE